VELPDGRGSPDEIKRREAQAILAACPAHSHVVALDEGGRTYSSVAFATSLAAWQDAGRTPCFVIGGAEGLDSSVLQRADATLSFGTLTWPHMLVRIMLVEQVYRAQAIAAGHPYHRAGRPD
jgi:23S rRNA (pseudouridine1915-N3)-methyltransferase